MRNAVCLLSLQAACCKSHSAPCRAVQHAAAKQVSHLQELPHVRWAACSHLRHPPLRRRLQPLSPCRPDQGRSVQRPGHKLACCAQTAHAPLAAPGSSSPAGLQAVRRIVSHLGLSFCQLLVCSPFAPVLPAERDREPANKSTWQDMLEHAAHWLSAWQTNYKLLGCSLLVPNVTRGWEQQSASSALSQEFSVWQ